VSFAHVGLLAAIVTVPFGLGFLLLPEALSAQYGIVDFNAGTLLLARLFGCMLLFAGAAAFVARRTSDAELQSRLAGWFSFASLLGMVASWQGTVSGATNALGWVTVATYGLFTVAWGAVAVKRAI
jgi:uncharacterized membrane protein YhaH (DUF805 family)